MTAHLDALLAEVRACTVCAAHLPHGPRPVVQVAAGARLVIVGQAPGARVHASGVPWDDDSGTRLRDWTGLDTATFYDPMRVALLPMGFCYPGAGAGADLPPRPECAPLWHDRLMAALPGSRLLLLVGIHAQGRYLAARRAKTLTETVRDFRSFLPGHFPLPHPSWRSTGWMKRNPWFETDVLPALRTAVRDALA
ncbi:MAG: uracil-DNA glycosylase family protein [Alphaproteobacteria bacterium]|nr:uracil-DNA glycosylase family protein [Alphaproteobacteria bacterium]